MISQTCLGIGITFIRRGRLSAPPLPVDIFVLACFLCNPAKLQLTIQTETDFNLHFKYYLEILKNEVELIERLSKTNLSQ